MGSGGSGNTGGGGNQASHSPGGTGYGGGGVGAQGNAGEMSGGAGGAGMAGFGGGGIPGVANSGWGGPGGSAGRAVGYGGGGNSAGYNPATAAKDTSGAIHYGNYGGYYPGVGTITPQQAYSAQQAGTAFTPGVGYQAAPSPGGTGYGSGGVGAQGNAGEMSGGAGGAGMAGFGGGGFPGVANSGWGGPGGSAGRAGGSGTGTGSGTGVSAPGYAARTFSSAIPTTTNPLTIRPGQVITPGLLTPNPGYRTRPGIDPGMQMSPETFNSRQNSFGMGPQAPAPGSGSTGGPSRENKSGQSFGPPGNPRGGYGPGYRGF